MTQRILFISFSKRGSHFYNDASARYRCFFPAEHLNELNIPTDVIHASKLNAISPQNYQLIIFHRPQYSYQLKHFLRKLNTLHIKAVVDFDDLLFTPSLSQHSAAVQSGYMSLSVAKKQAKAYQKALMLFDFCWVSTDTLASQVTRIKKSIHVSVCPNKLPLRWAKLADTIPASERLKNKVIRYMPGTSHHKHDFHKIEQCLIELLAEDKTLQLEIIGPLAFDIKAFPQAQVSQQPFVTFEQLPDIISSSWLTLAPLDNNLFNQCKSGLKFWESGLFAVPVICSPLADLTRYKNKGLCLSDDIGLWRSFINEMKKPNAYNTASKAAQRSAQQALFSHEKIDKRLASVKGYNHKTQQVAHQSLAVSTKKTVNYYHQQLIMCAYHGPDWPAAILDPTCHNHKAANACFRQTSSAITVVTPEQECRLLQQASKKILANTPKKKHIFLRKLRKLRTSPYDFFRDMIINRLN